MGEILRAVLQEACIFSRPAFYTMQLTIPNPRPPVGGGITLTGMLQTFSDRWFLAMSLYAADQAQSGVANVSPMLGSLGTIFDPANSKASMNISGDPDLWGGPVNAAFTLPHYILIPPSGQIAFSLDVLDLAVNPGTDIVRVQMHGIEYSMPGRN